MSLFPPLFGGGKSFWLVAATKHGLQGTTSRNQQSAINREEARLSTHDCIHAVDMVAVPAPNHVGAHHLAACSIAD